MSACLALPPTGTPLEAARSFLFSLKTSGPLLVAVSGGGDSMALLTALSETARESGGPTIVAATVDHRLRRASAGEAREVAGYCSARGIRHFTLEWTGDKPASGLQAAARLARYRLLAELAERIGAIGIATGHTADDQAETIAMRAERGSGDEGRGLAGMAPATLFDASQWILRPFLSIRRRDLRHWLSERGIGWVDDPSNDDGRFERVRVRNLQMPLRSAEARDAAARRQAESDAIAGFLGARARGRGGVVVTLTPDDMQRADPLAHRAGAVVMALAGGRPHLPPRRSRERLAAFISSGRPGRLTLSRAVADCRREGLHFYRECRDLQTMRLHRGESGLVDGRYRVGAAGGDVVDVLYPDRAMVAAGAERNELAGLPAGVARRTLAATPVLDRQGTRSFLFEPEVRDNVERHLALFDVFLPLFDYTLANRCAELFDRLPYRRPPLDIG